MVDSPEKVIPVIVEAAEGEHGVNHSEVGIFRCKRCDTMFPQVMSSRHYLFVPQTEFTSLGKELSSLRSEKGTLEKSIQEHIGRENALAEEGRKAQIAGLESRAEQLESYVSYLRSQKRELEEETAH